MLKQIISITFNSWLPSLLIWKKKVRSAEVPSHKKLLNSISIYKLPESTSVDLGNVRGKHYYKMLNKNSTMQPTGITVWKINSANEYRDSENKFSFVYHSKKIINGGSFHSRCCIEFFKFRLADDKICLFCPNRNSIVDTFLDWIVTQSFYLKRQYGLTM